MQLPNAVWNSLGVKKIIDAFAHNPTCDDGHVLTHVALVDFLDDADPICDMCHVPLELGQHAFTCYQCVQSYFLSLPIPNETIETKLQKGYTLCQSCAYRRQVIQRNVVLSL